MALNAVDGFVVVWTSDGSDGSDSSYRSVQGQRFAANGSSVGGELQVNTYTTGAQASPAVALYAGGSFVVVWNSLGSGGTDSSSFSIQKTVVLPQIFADGLESGDTDAWN